VDCIVLIVVSRLFTCSLQGVTPNVFRNSIINAAELASYDQFKQSALKYGMKDTVPTHLACGLAAGFVATVFGSPMDVVKTRVMNTKLGPDGKPLYSGMVDCIVKTLRNEGPLAFYNGFLPNFMRIGSWNVVCFLEYFPSCRLTRIVSR
jgi:solute carrier family 25 uncoupling protein 8/9